jgi:hypothetical protein
MDLLAAWRGVCERWRITLFQRYQEKNRDIELTERKTPVLEAQVNRATKTSPGGSRWSSRNLS